MGKRGPAAERNLLSPRGMQRLATVLAFALAAAGLVAGCRTLPSPGELFAPASPHERYADSLRQAGLADTAVGRAWLAAADHALTAPVAAELPAREVLFFDPAEPFAAAYRLRLRRGQRLRVQVAAESGAAGRFFLDLFEQAGRGDDEPRRVAGAEAREELVHEVAGDGLYLLRLQPELLAGGRLEVILEAGPSLVFPVSGAASRRIGSRFGDPRDSGRRSHHGVDIFADRGTPAVAAADAWVTRVGENPLGGNVVWLRSGGGLSFYYAHLDRQLVRTGQRVAAGEPVGLVGNTGNARSTPPHLHFGLFIDGPVDPYYFLHDPGREPPAVEAPTRALGESARVTTELSRLRRGASLEAEIVTELPRHTLVRLVGASRAWHRVVLPAGGEGYVAARLLEPAAAPLRRHRSAAASPLLYRPRPGAPAVGALAAGEEVGVLGLYQGFLYVAATGDRRGWLPPA